MIWLTFFYPNYNSYTNIRVLDYQSMKNTIKGKLTMDSLESNGQTVGQNQECEQMCYNDLQSESKYPSMWSPGVDLPLEKNLDVHYVTKTWIKRTLT